MQAENGYQMNMKDEWPGRVVGKVAGGANRFGPGASLSM